MIAKLKKKTSGNWQTCHVCLIYIVTYNQDVQIKLTACIINSKMSEKSSMYQCTN
jgi:hypothetical protein